MRWMLEGARVLLGAGSLWAGPATSRRCSRVVADYAVVDDGPGPDDDVVHPDTVGQPFLLLHPEAGAQLPSPTLASCSCALSPTSALGPAPSLAPPASCPPSRPVLVAQAQ